MFDLSFFAYLFAFLSAILFVVVWKRHKRLKFQVIFAALFAIVVIVGVGILALDNFMGKETICTIIDVDSKIISNSKYDYVFSILRIKDNNDKSFWGLGRVSTLFFSRGVTYYDEPVRITYLPITRFVLGIEKDVSTGTPQLEILGLPSNPSHYVPIYYNDEQWLCWSILLLAFLIIYIFKKENK